MITLTGKTTVAKVVQCYKILKKVTDADDGKNDNNQS